jgi:hypothetical protein
MPWISVKDRAPRTTRTVSNADHGGLADWSKQSRGRLDAAERCPTICAAGRATAVAIHFRGLVLACLCGPTLVVSDASVVGAFAVAVFKTLCRWVGTVVALIPHRYNHAPVGSLGKRAL